MRSYIVVLLLFVYGPNLWAMRIVDVSYQDGNYIISVHYSACKKIEFNAHNAGCMASIPEISLIRLMPDFEEDTFTCSSQSENFTKVSVSEESMIKTVCNPALVRFEVGFGGEYYEYQRPEGAQPGSLGYPEQCMGAPNLYACSRGIDRSLIETKYAPAIIPKSPGRAVK